VQGRALTAEERFAERMRLTELATEVVRAEGRAACTLRRVTELAGVSRMTPYTYFADKEALLDAVRTAALARLGDAAEAALAAGEDLPARLRGVGRAYVVFALGEPELYDLVFEPCPMSDEHRSAAERYRRLAEAPLVEASALGLLALPPERVGHALWAATHGLIALHRAGKLRHGLDFEAVLQDVGDVLAFGFLRRGEG